MSKAQRRALEFDEDTLRRLNKAAQDLGISAADIIEQATKMALDELEGYAREAAAIRRHYERLNGRHEDWAEPLRRTGGAR